MANEILITKLGCPPAPGTMVPRAALTEALLRDWPAHRVCAAIAPAGYGKSTLLQQFREALRVQAVATAWLSVDTGDNDAARFLAYLASALDHALPGAGKRTLALLALGNAPSLRPALATLLCDVGAHGAPALLFLDDLHLLADAACVELLERLFNDAPPTLHFVVATRSAPVQGVDALRARGQLREFGLDALALSTDELRDYCRLRGAADVDDGFVEKLWASTEGWVAGVQLFFLAATTTDEKRRLLDGFDGRDRSIVDYLSSLLLQRQDDATREFLMKTSVLERLCAPLCHAMLPTLDGRAMLDHIEAAGLFVIPLDRHGQWYRYHHLFRDVLRAQLESRLPGAASDLLRSASAWCAAQGLRREAVDYALAARDFNAAAALLAQSGEEWAILRGDHRSIIDWIGRLPERTLDRWPDVRLYCAWSLLMTNQIEPALTALTRHERSAIAHPEWNSSATAPLAGMLRCMMAVFRDDQTTLRRDAAAWLAEWPDRSDACAAGVYMMLGYACHEFGEFDRGIAMVEQAQRAAERCGNPPISYGGRGLLGSLLWQRGDLAQAEQVLTAAIEFAWEAWGEHSQPVSLASLVLAAVQYETDRTGLAAESVRLGARIMDEFGAVEIAIIGPSVQARLLHLQGDEEGALGVLAKWQQRARAARLPRLDGMLLLDQIRLQLRMRRVDDAVTSLSRLQALAKALAPDASAGLRTALATLQAQGTALVTGETGHPREAARAWSRLIASARLRVLGFVEARVHQAACLHRSGQHTEAMRAFDDALHVGERHGLLRVFGDDRRLIEPLLRQFVAEQRRHGRFGALTPAYLGAVVSVCGFEVALDIREPLKPIAPDAPIGDVVLTERESRLLELIAEGLSNRQIAASLFVTEPTVKWHTHNIFVKLGVRQRTAALARAREMGVLS